MRNHFFHESDTHPSRFLFSPITLIKGAAVLGLAAAAVWLALQSNETTPLFWAVTALFAGCSLALLLLRFRIPAAAEGILLALLPAVCFYLLERCTHIPEDTMKWDAVILNLIFYYLTAMLLLLVTGRAKVCAYVLIAGSALTGLANYFVILFRSIPILPWDFYSIGTAASVAGDYEYTVTFPLLFIIYGFLTLFLLAGHFSLASAWNVRKTVCESFSSGKKLPGREKARILVRTAAIVLCMSCFGIYVHILWQPDVDDSFQGLDNTLFTPNYMFRTNGFAVAFLMDLRYLRIGPPEGYSADEVKELLSLQEDDSSTSVPVDTNDSPNIIVIMNEAFSDPAVLGEFTTNTDYMPFVHSLLSGADNTISGYMYSSILGGNTANSEFEFLTGNSMAFLPIGSVPYQQYIRDDIGGITKQLKSLGYESIAMHPYNSTGWNRNKVYDFLGFDEKRFISSFSGGERVRKYISDACLYDRIIRSYNTKGDAPLFAFAVTMQNHSGYSDGYDYDNFSVDVEMQEATSRYLNTYLSLMKVSDQALKDLISYFEQEEEKTIVVFFGDHQPNDYVINPIYQANGLHFDQMSLEEQQNRYLVPFLLWANYDIEEETDVYISANYISTLLMDTAGLPKTDYQTFLGNLRQEIPVITANMYVDKNGTFHTLDEENAWRDLLDTYEMIQYYELFDQ